MNALIAGGVLVVAVFLSLFFVPVSAHAQWITSTIGDIPRSIEKIIAKIDKRVWAVTLKTTLAQFAHTMAKDLGTFVGSGGEGGGTVFFEKGGGNFFAKAGRIAGGDFLDNLSKNTWGQSLCSPNLTVRLNTEINARDLLGFLSKKAKFLNVCEQTCQEITDVDKVVKGNMQIVGGTSEDVKQKRFQAGKYSIDNSLAIIKTGYSPFIDKQGFDMSATGPSNIPVPESLIGFELPVLVSELASNAKLKCATDKVDSLYCSALVKFLNENPDILNSSDILSTNFFPSLESGIGGMALQLAYDDANLAYLRATSDLDFSWLVKAGEKVGDVANVAALGIPGILASDEAGTLVEETAQGIEWGSRNLYNKVAEGWDKIFQTESARIQEPSKKSPEQKTPEYKKYLDDLYVIHGLEKGIPVSITRKGTDGDQTFTIGQAEMKDLIPAVKTVVNMFYAREKYRMFEALKRKKYGDFQNCIQSCKGLNSKGVGSCDLGKIRDNFKDNFKVQTTLGITDPLGRRVAYERTDSDFNGKAIDQKNKEARQKLSSQWEAYKKAGDVNRDIGGSLTAIVSGAQQNQAEAYRQERDTATATDINPPENPGGKKAFSATATKARIDSTSNQVTSHQNVTTGEIVADVIGAFKSSALAALQKKLFERTPPSGDVNTPQSRYSVPDATEKRTRGSVPAAPPRAGNIGIGTNENSNIEILTQLAKGGCDPQKYDSGYSFNSCAIDSQFFDAIFNKMTVREAASAGKIRGNAAFGYTALYDQGQGHFVATGGADMYQKRGDLIPYRTIQLLRKYRIAPSSWEVAAEYIKNYHIEPEKDQNAKPKNVTLNQLMDEFDNLDSPYFGMVDPNWLLTVPSWQCAQGEGYGDRIITETVSPKITSAFPPDQIANANGEFEVQITRQEYCPDPVSCLRTDAGGACKAYGSCTREQDTWKLKGDECSDQFTSCQTYSIEPGAREAQSARQGEAKVYEVSYLKNTLSGFDICSENNAGCLEYSRDYYFHNQSYDPNVFFNNEQVPPTDSPGIKVFQCSKVSIPNEKCYFNEQETAQGCFLLNTDKTPEFCSATVPELDKVVLDTSQKDAFTCTVFGASAEEDGTVYSASCTYDPMQGKTICTITDTTISPDPITCGAVGSSAAKKADTIIALVAAKCTLPSGASCFVLGQEYQNFVQPDTASCVVSGLYGVDADTKDLTPLAGQSQTCFLRASHDSNYIKLNYNSNAVANGNVCTGVIAGCNEYVEVAPNPGFRMSKKDQMNTLKGAYLKAQKENTTYSDLNGKFSADDAVPFGIPAHALPDAGSDSAKFTMRNIFVQGNRYESSQCSEAEVGCRLFSPLAIGAPRARAAILKEKDVCLEECVNFGTYAEGVTPVEYVLSRRPFEDQKLLNIIPSLSSIPVCTAPDVGCEEFVNEETKSQNNLLHFSAVQYCARPNELDLAARAASYKTFEGEGKSDLAWRLLASNQNFGQQPCTNPEYSSDGKVRCVDPKKTAECDKINEYCREFVYQDIHTGQSFGTKLDVRRTIEVMDAGNQNECLHVKRIEDKRSGYHLKGLRQCASAAVNCREYRGGEDAVKDIIGPALAKENNGTFEDGTLQGWEGNVLRSAVALERGGKSMQIGIGGNVGIASTSPDFFNLVKAGETHIADTAGYVISFNAKPLAPVSVWEPTSDAPLLGSGWLNSLSLVQVRLLEFLKADTIEGAGVTVPVLLREGAEIKKAEGVGFIESPNWAHYVIGPLYPKSQSGKKFIPGAIEIRGAIAVDDIRLSAATNTKYIVTQKDWHVPTACNQAQCVLDQVCTGTDKCACASNNNTDQNDNAISPRKTYCEADPGQTSCLYDKPGAQLGCKLYTDDERNNIAIKDFSSPCAADKVGCSAVINTFNTPEPTETKYMQRECSIALIAGEGKVDIPAEIKLLESITSPSPDQTLRLERLRELRDNYDEKGACKPDAVCTCWGEFLKKKPGQAWVNKEDTCKISKDGLNCFIDTTNTFSLPQDAIEYIVTANRCAEAQKGCMQAGAITEQASVTDLICSGSLMIAKGMNTQGNDGAGEFDTDGVCAYPLQNSGDERPKNSCLCLASITAPDDKNAQDCFVSYQGTECIVQAHGYTSAPRACSVDILEDTVAADAGFITGKGDCTKPDKCVCAAQFDTNTTGIESCEVNKDEVQCSVMTEQFVLENPPAPAECTVQIMREDGLSDAQIRANGFDTTSEKCVNPPNSHPFGCVCLKDADPVHSGPESCFVPKDASSCSIEVPSYTTALCSATTMRSTGKTETAIRSNGFTLGGDVCTKGGCVCEAYNFDSNPATLDTCKIENPGGTSCIIKTSPDIILDSQQCDVRRMRQNKISNEDIAKLGFIVDGSSSDGECKAGSAPCECSANYALAPDTPGRELYKNCYVSAGQTTCSLKKIQRVLLCGVNPIKATKEDKTLSEAEKTALTSAGFDLSTGVCSQTGGCVCPSAFLKGYPKNKKDCIVRNGENVCIANSDVAVETGTDKIAGVPYTEALCDLPSACTHVEGCACTMQADPEREGLEGCTVPHEETACKIFVPQNGTYKPECSAGILRTLPLPDTKSDDALINLGYSKNLQCGKTDAEGGCECSGNFDPDNKALEQSCPVAPGGAECSVTSGIRYELTLAKCNASAMRQGGASDADIQSSGLTGTDGACNFADDGCVCKAEFIKKDTKNPLYPLADCSVPFNATYCDMNARIKKQEVCSASVLATRFGVPQKTLLNSGFSYGQFCNKQEGGCVCEADLNPQQTGLEQCTVPFKGTECSNAISISAEGTQPQAIAEQFIKNNPSDYQNILCAEGELGCGTFKTFPDNQSEYFIAPNSNVCEYREISAGSWQWVKQSAGSANEKDLAVSCGEGGNPDLQNWARVCPAEQNLCTEFKDPLAERSGTALPAYYRLNNLNLEDFGGATCAKVDPEIGCRLFADSTKTLFYDSSKTLPDGTASPECSPEECFNSEYLAWLKKVRGAEGDRCYVKSAEETLFVGFNVGAGTPPVDILDDPDPQPTSMVCNVAVMASRDVPTAGLGFDEIGQCTTGKQLDGGCICEADFNPQISGYEQCIVQKGEKDCTIVTQFQRVLKDKIMPLPSRFFTYALPEDQKTEGVCPIGTASIGFGCACEAKTDEAPKTYDCVVYPGKSYCQIPPPARAISSDILSVQTPGCTIDSAGSDLLFKNLCDANRLMKVERDRECAEWLACENFTLEGPIGSGTQKKVCSSVVSCADKGDINPDATCKAPLPRSINENSFTSADIKPPKDVYDEKGGSDAKSLGFLARVRTLSGLSKISFEWSDQARDPYLVLVPPLAQPIRAEGLYPVSSIRQVGNEPSSKLQNGDFENDKPLDKWLNCVACAIKKRGEGQEGSTSSPPSFDALRVIWGKQALLIPPSNPDQIIEQEIKVEPGRYVLSLWVNMQKGGQKKFAEKDWVAQVDINGTDTECGQTPKDPDKEAFCIRPKSHTSGWYYLSASLDLTGRLDAAGSLTIKLHSPLQVDDMLFDEIKINNHYEVAPGVFEAPRCRLYPAGNALMCDDRSSTGEFKEGWKGICLERSPADPLDCVSWLPLDTIQGESGRSGAGAGVSTFQNPVADDAYYCIETMPARPLAPMPRLICAGVSPLSKHAEQGCYLIALASGPKKAFFEQQFSNNDDDAWAYGVDATHFGGSTQINGVEMPGLFAWGTSMNGDLCVGKYNEEDGERVSLGTGKKLSALVNGDTDYVPTPTDRDECTPGCLGQIGHEDLEDVFKGRYNKQEAPVSMDRGIPHISSYVKGTLTKYYSKIVYYSFAQASEPGIWRDGDHDHADGDPYNYAYGLIGYCYKDQIWSDYEFRMFSSRYHPLSVYIEKPYGKFQTFNDAGTYYENTCERTVLNPNAPHLVKEEQDDGAKKCDIAAMTTFNYTPLDGFEKIYRYPLGGLDPGSQYRQYLNEEDPKYHLIKSDINLSKGVLLWRATLDSDKKDSKAYGDMPQQCKTVVKVAKDGQNKALVDMLDMLTSASKDSDFPIPSTAQCKNKAIPTRGALPIRDIQDAAVSTTALGNSLSINVPINIHQSDRLITNIYQFDNPVTELSCSENPIDAGASYSYAAYKTCEAGFYTENACISDADCKCKTGDPQCIVRGTGDTFARCSFRFENVRFCGSGEKKGYRCNKDYDCGGKPLGVCAPRFTSNISNKASLYNSAVGLNLFEGRQQLARLFGKSYEVWEWRDVDIVADPHAFYRGDGMPLGEYDLVDSSIDWNICYGLPTYSACVGKRVDVEGYFHCDWIGGSCRPTAATQAAWDITKVQKCELLTQAECGEVNENKRTGSLLAEQNRGIVNCAWNSKTSVCESKPRAARVLVPNSGAKKCTDADLTTSKSCTDNTYGLGCKWIDDVNKCREKTIEESGIMTADSISPLAIPSVSHVRINGKSVLSPIKQNEGTEPPVEVTIKEGEQSVFVSLTFKGVVDKNAVPIKRVLVDWGVKGSSLSEQNNTANAYEFSFQKQYTYADLIMQDRLPPGQCSQTENYCIVYPKVQIMDNWDWCGGNKTVKVADEVRFRSTAFYDGDSKCVKEIFKEPYTVLKVKEYLQGVPWYPLGAIKIRQF